jgi:hypothetical protein
VLHCWLLTLKISVPTEQNSIFPSPMFIILFMLNRCIIGGPISFEVEVVSAQFFDSVRPFAGDQNNLSSGVWCFDVLEPDVFIVFFPNHSFYNGSCA